MQQFFSTQSVSHRRPFTSDIIVFFFFLRFVLGFYSGDRQERGKERRGETCCKGHRERDSNTRHTVRIEPMWHAPGPLGQRAPPLAGTFILKGSATRSLILASYASSPCTGPVSTRHITLLKRHKAHFREKLGA